MKKKTKVSSPAKKASTKKATGTTAKKVVKKVAKKAVKKAVTKKAAARKVSKKNVTKASSKATPRKTSRTVTKTATKTVTKAGPKAAAKPAKKAVGKAAAKTAQKVATKSKSGTKAATRKAATSSAGKSTASKKGAAAKMQKGVVTTVLPPKLGNARIASSTRPARTAVKAPKAPQAKLAVAASGTPTRKRLNKEELKFFENLLNEKKETLLQEQSYLEDNALRLNSKEGAGDLSSHAYHLADHATETQDREQAFHLASREGKFLFYIEEALTRVRNGTFGICKKCQTLIPRARLEAVPTAKMCINCKSQQESASD